MKVWCLAALGFLILANLNLVESTISEEEATQLVQRHLEEQQQDDAVVDFYEYNLANFSLRFDRCQYVKMYDDDLAHNEETNSFLAVKHFAVYRLCPSDNCQDCNSGAFGRYVSELEDYLVYTVAEQASAFEYMCNNCQEQCNEYGGNCTGCGKICYQLENLEANGKIDAGNYIECQKLELNYGDDAVDEDAVDENAVDENGDDAAGGERKRRRLDQANDDGNQFQLYIGPRCSRDGTKVLLGLFSDDECLEPYTDAEPEDYLEGEISYHLFAHTSSNDGAYCLSCMESDEDQNAADEADGDDVNQMCENLYNTAAKCESKYGLYGFVDQNREDRDYENQVENEFMVCNFIDSLLSKSYTETGDINLDGGKYVISRQATPLQKTAVSALALIIAGLTAIVFFLQKQIESTTPKLDLACQSADAQLT